MNVTTNRKVILLHGCRPPFGAHFLQLTLDRCHNLKEPRVSSYLACSESGSGVGGAIKRRHLWEEAGGIFPGRYWVAEQLQCRRLFGCCFLAEIREPGGREILRGNRGGSMRAGGGTSERGYSFS